MGVECIAIEIANKIVAIVVDSEASIQVSNKEITARYNDIVCRSRCIKSGCHCGIRGIRNIHNIDTTGTRCDSNGIAIERQTESVSRRYDSICD